MDYFETWIHRLLVKAPTIMYIIALLIGLYVHPIICLIAAVVLAVPLVFCRGIWRGYRITADKYDRKNRKY